MLNVLHGLVLDPNTKRHFSAANRKQKTEIETLKEKILQEVRKINIIPIYLLIFKSIYFIGEECASLRKALQI